MEVLLDPSAIDRERHDVLGRVVSVRPRGAKKQLLTDLGASLHVPRYAVVGRGATLAADGRGVYIQARNGRARLLPAYVRRGRLRLGDRVYPILVKELDEDMELDAYQHLSDLHYRGERGFGRKAVLVMVCGAVALPRVLGYVEITTGFLMNSPRTRVLDARFSDGPVSWSRWGSREMSQLTSLVARVSRVVVHPELRGLNIGTVLLGHAQSYARSHFHAGRLRPVFLEMTADMAKFVPFADAAGMRFIGYTEGNLHRVAKDVRYLLSRRDLMEMPTDSLKARGIMQAQRRYVSGVAAMPSGRSLDEVSLALRDGTMFLDAATYARFHGVFRLPKPTYLAGLTAPSRAFLDRRLKEVEVPAQARFTPAPLAPIHSQISLTDVSISYHNQVPRTERSSTIQEAFGIRPEAFETPVVTNLSMTIDPGEICLVYGPSGSGKTTLLNLLVDGRLPFPAIVTGDIHLPDGAHLGRFADLPDDQPLIEVLAADQPTAAAIHALNLAGLSDAKLYLRRFSELSNGQRYRAMLASLMASDANVWVADEFLSTLDATTASIVAGNVAKHVRARRVTLIVGAPHFDSFFSSLAPDVVLRLTSPWESEVMRGSAFRTRWAGRSRTRLR